MNCAVARLDAYLDGELEPFERADVEAHLQDCPACARELETLAAASAAVKAWTPAGPRTPSFAPWILAAAAALLAVVLLRPGADKPRAPEAVELAAGERVAHAGRRTYVARRLAPPARIDCAGATLLAANARFEVEEQPMRTKTVLGAAAAVTAVTVIWGTVEVLDRTGRTTLEEGRHELPAPAEAGERGGPGAAEVSEAVAPPPEEDAFDPFTGVTGLVLDPAGAPVPEAAVRLFYDTTGYAGREPDETTATGADGRFRMGPLRPGFRLVAFKAGTGAGGGRESLVPGADVTIRLVPAARLEGRLVDAADGSAVAGAICVTRSAGGGWNHERAVSDADGRFVLETCDPDEPYLWVRPAEHESFVCAPVLRAGGTAREEFALRRLGTHRVQVVDADTKAPVRILRAASTNQPARIVRATGNGFLVFPLSENDGIDVVVEAEGYPPWSFQFGYGRAPEVVEVSGGVAARVRVRDDKDRPIAGARVEFSGQVGLAPVRDAVSDAGGLAETRLAPTQQPLRLRVTAEGFAGADETVQPGNGDVEVEVRLRRAGTLEGRVVDAAGAPVPCARLLANGVYGRSGADGRFRVDGVPSGDAKVGVLAADHVPRHVPAVIRAGETTDVGDVVLDAGAEISGRAVDGNGEPVRLSSVWTPGLQGEVGPDGTFRTGYVAAGQVVELSLFAGTLVRKIEVVGGTRDLVVRFEGHASIRGRVTVPPGETLPVGLYVGCAPRSGRNPGRVGPQARVLTDGTFRVDGLAAGTYELSASARGSPFASPSADVEVGPGETAEVTLRLEVGGDIEVTVDPGGLGAKYLVQAQRADGQGRSYGSYENRPDRPTVLRSLQPGAYVVTVRTFERGWRTLPRTVTVTPHGTATCAFAFVRTGDLVVHEVAGTKLTLLDASGAQVPASDEERRELTGLAWQRLKEAGHTDSKTIRSLADGEIERMLAEAGPDGTWRRCALLPGRYVLVTPTGRREIVVAAGETTDVP